MVIDAFPLKVYLELVNWAVFGVKDVSLDTRLLLIVVPAWEKLMGLLMATLSPLKFIF